MLIRTKLLLLAGIPLPVLLILGMAALFNAREQWQSAEQLALGLTLVDISHATSASALNRRDVEAALVIRQSRGLEALLLGDLETDETVEGTVPGAANEATATALAELPVDQMPPAVRAAASSLTMYLEQLQVRSLQPGNATLGEVCAAYEPIMRQIGALPELLVDDARSGAHAHRLRTLALLNRYEDALARERLYVRYAIETNTLPPQLQREFSAAEGIAAFQRDLLEQVFADEALRQSVGGALERARVAGRAAVLLQLQSFADRQDKLSLLTDALGYGGMIHHYKNFLLRGDPQLRAEFEAHATGAAAVVDELLAGVALAPAERSDAEILARTIADYRRRFERIAAMRAQGAAPARRNAPQHVPLHLHLVASVNRCIRRTRARDNPMPSAEQGLVR